MLAAPEPVSWPHVITLNVTDGRDVLTALERVRLDIDFLGQLLGDAASRSVNRAISGIRQGLDRVIEQTVAMMCHEATSDGLVLEDPDGR